jgi:DNA-binding Xre family transcriptional regulator
MSEMNDLRSLVMSHKGQWTRIARLTGLSTKTLSRIASGEADDVRISTADKIRSAVSQLREADQPAAA